VASYVEISTSASISTGAPKGSSDIPTAKRQWLPTTFFENYQWSWVGLVGVVLIIVGNVLVLSGKTKIVARD